MVWLIACILLAFSIEAMTGFGSIVIALSLAALVYDISWLMVILVPLNLIMTLPMCIALRKHIHVRLLFMVIGPLMIIGTLLGQMLLPLVSADWLKLLFALLIIWFSARALWVRHPHPLSHGFQKGLILSAGVTHGLFASGGPLLVYALSRAGLDKASFRATLLCVWLALNTGLALWFWHDGQFSAHTDTLMTLAPAVIVGMLVGQFLHNKINNERFLPVVFSILLLVALLLLAQSIQSLWF